MDDDAALEDLSLLPRGEKIPQGETWLGSPARPSGRAPQTSPAATVGKMAAFCGRIVARGRAADFSAAGRLRDFARHHRDERIELRGRLLLVLFLSPFVGLSFVILLALEIVVVKWLLLGRVKPGRHPCTAFSISGNGSWIKRFA